MSHIDDLIAEHCPDGVEHKPLGQVGEFIRGNGLQKSDLQEFGIPAIHYGQVHTIYGVWTNQTISYVSPTLASRLRRARHGDIILATTSEDDAAVGKATAWLGNEEVAVSGDAFIFRHILEPRYVAYFLNSASFQEQKKRYITGTKVKRLSSFALERIIIPVPPIEIQHEIVRILDTFSALEAELELQLQAELEARRKQYVYYRDSLLSFAEHSEATDRQTDRQTIIHRRRLNEVAICRRGSAMTEKTAVAGDIPVVANGPVPTYSHNAANRNGEMVVIARSGAYAGLVSYWNRPVFLTDAFSVHPDTGTLNTRYAFHFLQNSQKHLHASKKGAGVPHVRVREIENLIIPIPPLHEQERIVEILDKFESLTNDLSIGLPAELAARRKQYEYYRDRLLTFKELHP